MNFGFNVDVYGSEFVQKKLKEESKLASKAANLAVKDTTDHGRAIAKKEIMSQVNLSPSYLDGKSSRGRRLDTRFDRKGEKLFGRIIGRYRPTSLARYGAKELSVPGQKRGRRRAGVSVNVKRRTHVKRAFLMKLKNGNVGFALRVDKGEKPKRRFNGKPLYKKQGENNDIYLLYGPSIHQVFSDVAPDIAPDLSVYLNKEFVRQYTRLRNG